MTKSAADSLKPKLGAKSALLSPPVGLGGRSCTCSPHRAARPVFMHIELSETTRAAVEGQTNVTVCRNIKAHITCCVYTVTILFHYLLDSFIQTGSQRTTHCPTQDFALDSKTTSSVLKCLYAAAEQECVSAVRMDVFMDFYQTSFEQLEWRRSGIM